MELGVCVPYKDAARYAGQMQFVEENVQRLLVPLGDEALFQQAAPGSVDFSPPIRYANSFLPATIRSVGPEYDLEGIVQYGRIAFERARSVGIRAIVFGSGGSRMIPEGFDRAKAEEQFVDVCSRLAPIAAAHDIVLAIEPLNRGECNFINTLEDGASIVRRVGHPSIRLLADLYHMMREDETPEAIRRVGDLVVHVHLAEKERRSSPGRAGDDFRPFMRELHRVGYRGAFSIECRWENQDDDVSLGLRTMAVQLQESGYSAR
jgi:sugar phosphate isomerase/epimerase